MAARGLRLQLVRGLANDLVNEHRGRLTHSFSSALSGFSARLSADEAATLARDPRVDFVEQDGVVVAEGTQSSPSWGLDRIDQRKLPLDGSYTYDLNGSGVDVFVIDSGIRSTHAEFGGRVDTVNSYAGIADGYGSEDCFGHGTMVAGLIGGASYGVAKGVTLHSVRVLGCSGYGSVSDLVAGVDWVTAQRQTATRAAGNAGVRPWLANVSLITGISQCLDNAVTFSMGAGVTFVVAAGNSGADACMYSPAHVGGAITVGASNGADNVWISSNGGTCVDVFAPGVSAATSYNRSDTDSVLFTGTSAAAPAATGAAALYLAMRPSAAPAEVASVLTKAASAGRLAAMPSGSPNLLLFTRFNSVDLPPVASFTFQCTGRKCSFDPSASEDDKRIKSYAWTFGDGTSAANRNAKHRFPKVGSRFVVTLTVTDTAKQQTAASLTVQFVSLTIESLPETSDSPDDTEEGSSSALR